MLTFNLNGILKARGINKPMAFIVKAGIPYHSAHILLKNKNATIKFSHLQKLCEALNCQPNDLFIWQNNSSTPLHPQHALNKLTIQNSEITIHQKLASMSISQLRELEKTFTQLNPEN